MNAHIGVKKHLADASKCFNNRPIKHNRPLLFVTMYTTGSDML